MDEPKKVIMVVDDETGMREMLRWRLQGGEFEIKAAADGQEALALLSQGAVDLVVTDLTMPRLDGFGLIEALRRQAPRMGIIVITGFATVESAVFAMRQGASDVLLKPFDPLHLVRRIREVLAQP